MELSMLSQVSHMCHIKLLQAVMASSCWSKRVWPFCIEASGHCLTAWLALASLAAASQVKSSCDASNTTCSTVQFPTTPHGLARKQTGIYWNLENNGKQTQTYSLILAMQRCTGHDSGKLHLKKCYCRCPAVDDNSSDAVAFMLLSLLLSFFVSPPRLPLAIPSKQGDMRNSGKGSEVEKDWKRENMKGDEGSKRQDCHAEDSLSPTRPMEKQKKNMTAVGPWGCQNMSEPPRSPLLFWHAIDLRQNLREKLPDFLEDFAEDFVALMCQS